MSAALIGVAHVAATPAKTTAASQYRPGRWRMHSLPTCPRRLSRPDWPIYRAFVFAAPRKPKTSHPAQIAARGLAPSLDMPYVAVSVVQEQPGNQPPLKSLIEEELRPGPAIQSDTDIIHDFRQRSGTVYHPCGTCRMGEDDNAVVLKRVGTSPAVDVQPQQDSCRQLALRHGAG